MRGFKLTKAYTAPPMPWGIPVSEIAAFLERIPALHARSIQTYADPFPERTRFYKLLSSVAFLRNRLAPGLVHGYATAERGA